MTKIKIGGQKYNLEDLPASFRNRIKSELDKEGIKYDEEDDTVDNVKRKDIKEDKKKSVDSGKSDTKIKKKVGEDISLFRKMFGYP